MSKNQRINLMTMLFSRALSCSLLFFLFTCFTLSAQSKMQIIEMEREAEANFRANNFHVALPILLKLDSIRPNTENYTYSIGVCYIAIDDNINALKYLEKCLSSSTKHPAALNYYLGRAYHLSHRLDDAIKYYTLYQNEFKDNKSKTNQQLVEEVERDIQMCRNGKELMSKSLEIEIVNLGPEINSQYPEYGPVISADETEIIFTSNRPNTTGGRIDDIDGLYYEDVYISNKKNGKWSEPLQMSTNLNTTNHDASIALSPDGQTLFLYRFDQDSPSSNSSGDLFTSKLEGKVWARAERLSDKINSKGWEPSATITEDGKTLYFASDKPGGKGGTDIYYSRKLSDGNWDKPVSIGNVINTEYDEDCPFIHPDGKTLYFSSKGHNTMGGFDIFISKYDVDTKAWGKPENFGYPISTAHDDLHFVISTNAKRIYFSTIKEGGYGNKDIYYANISKKESAKVLLITGIVTDSVTGKPIEVKLRVTDKETGEEIGTYQSNSSSGKYTVILNEGKNYDLIFSSPKFGTHYENVNLIEVKEYEEIQRNVSLVPQSREVIINITDAETKKSLKTKIKLMNLDSRDEITLDEEAGRDGRYGAKLKEGNIYNIEINKIGYVFTDNQIFIPTSEQVKSDSIPTFDIQLRPLKEGTSLILKNIYFATDESKPLATSKEELDKVALFMKQNSGAVIEISAHTDDVGNDEYNLKLSEKRAQEVVNYLVANGVPPARLKAKGHGKNVPVSKGTSDEERQQNRRVELKILKAN
jgi:outer membrane protein OmpA-like peptidoglycan-associated protein/tetratricopeptide (TPR) repeat protein